MANSLALEKIKIKIYQSSMLFPEDCKEELNKNINLSWFVTIM